MCQKPVFNSSFDNTDTSLLYKQFKVRIQVRPNATSSTATMSFENMNLGSLYACIDNATTPLATLGLANGQASSALDIKSAYRSLALRLHPDKCPSPDFLDTHHALFQKVQQAYDEL